MTQLLVPNIEDDLREKLLALARRNGRSLEEEAREILRQAVWHKSNSAPNLGSRLANRFSKIGLDQCIPEQRGKVVEPTDFAR